ncbi:MAG: flagellar hook-length control protein FliK [Desulfuromonadaceae bacterium]|nr:flagellar hook-length control protein FliK [Desulfuromonadaceae bacterium]
MDAISLVPPPAMTIQPVAATQHIAQALEHNLLPYQFIQASVAETDGRQVLLDMGQQKLWAQAQTDLQTGQKLNLQVLSTEPRLLFQLLPASLDRRLLGLLHLFDHRTELGAQLSALLAEVKDGATPEQLEALQRLTQQLSGQGRSVPTPAAQDLAGLVRMLGLDFEGRLYHGQLEDVRQGLKGILLALQQEDGQAEAVRENAGQLLQQVELLQVCRARLAQDGVLFLPLPFDFLDQGYALIEEHPQSEGKEGDGETRYSLTLNVTMSQLGAINVHMLLEGKNLFVRLRCRNPESVGRIRSTQDQLQQALAPVGLRALNVEAGGEDPVVLLMKRLRPDAPVLDQRI